MSSAVNHRLISSTPILKQKDSQNEPKKRKKLISESASSKERKKIQKQIKAHEKPKNSGQEEKQAVRVPIRISPGKENVPSKQANEGVTREGAWSLASHMHHTLLCP